MDSEEEHIAKVHAIYEAEVRAIYEKVLAEMNEQQGQDESDA